VTAIIPVAYSRVIDKMPNAATASTAAFTPSREMPTESKVRRSYADMCDADDATASATSALTETASAMARAIVREVL
jgi:hypothetical protein